MKKYLNIFFILLILGSFLLILPQKINAATPVIYENYTNSNAYIGVYGGNCTAQVFTTNRTNISHTVTSILLFLQRVGTLGDIKVSIRTVGTATFGFDGSPYPDLDLASVTIDGNLISTTPSWYTFDFTSSSGTGEYSLIENTKYAIMVSNTAGNATNRLLWAYHTLGTGNLYGGYRSATMDGGVGNWLNESPNIMTYVIYGNPSISVDNGAVFMTYLQTGDWLVTCNYRNFYPPYYQQGSDVTALFNLQLVNNTTVIASTLCADWGYRPGCVYLAASEVTALTWGSTTEGYKIRLQATFAPTIYAQYTIQAGDWKGDDLPRLDTWVRLSATVIGIYYNTALMVYVPNKGLVLNDQGNIYFTNGIPALNIVRPDLFQKTSSDQVIKNQHFNQAYQSELVWQTMLGPNITSLLNSTGNVFSVNGATIGMLVSFLFYAIVAAFAFTPGHAVAAIIIPLPLIIAAFYVGLIALVVLGFVCALAAILLVWQVWWNKTV